MRSIRFVLPLGGLVVGGLLSGCAVRDVDFSKIERPPRAAELAAYDVFVGSWDWTAKVHNASGEGANWTGTAEWNWTLDERTLHGRMSAKSKDAEFEAAGIWSWHPKKKKYIWWMFNNWGYPQQGTAKYCAACDKCAGCWTMKYKSVGLDGTTSHGEYLLTIKDPNTIDWCMTEWADPLHFVQKTCMSGTYTRRK